MSNSFDDYQGPQEPRKPSHPLVKWRESHSFQQLPVAITIAARIAELKKTIAYAQKIGRAYRETHQHARADAKEREIANLQAVLDDLQHRAERVSLDTPIDEEVDNA